MKMILIEPKRKARVVELPTRHDYRDIKKLLKIDSPVTCVTRKIRGKEYDIWCDDEGLFKDKRYMCGFSRTKNEILCGSLLIAKSDDEGKTKGLTKKEIEDILSSFELISNKDFLDFSKHKYIVDEKGEANVFDYRGFGVIKLNMKGNFIIYDI